MTKLADGRILIVGGHDAISCTLMPTVADPITDMFEPHAQFHTTASAEIYDPATGACTATGSLNVARAGHAGILLPTGQVLIVGGLQATGESTFVYPNQTELFDPNTGTFSAMDHLDYGLSEPKLALLQDGGVFVAGQIQAPMETPAASPQAQSLKMRASASIASTSLLTGAALFGTVASSAVGRMDEVEWTSGINVSLNQQTVPLPHWEFGVDVADGQGSKRPIVCNVSKAHQNELQVEVTLLKGPFISGVVASFPKTGKLIGTLNSVPYAGVGTTPAPLRMEGDIVLCEGGQLVSLQATNMPSAVNWYRGDVTWKVKTSQGATLNLQGISRLELFTVLGGPTEIFDSTGGVWVEALRLVGEKANLLGASTPNQALSCITDYLFNKHGLIYDSKGGGGTKFGDVENDKFGYGGGEFYLKKYLNPPLPPNNLANCYDQAAGVQSLAGALGVQCDWVFLGAIQEINTLMNPFGYINDTHLLGFEGFCNNPFFRFNSTTELIAWDDSDRSSFTSHAFIRESPQSWETYPKPLAARTIFDACVGPHLGVETMKQYLSNVVDVRKDPHIDMNINPENQSNIKVYGVTKVVSK